METLMCITYLLNFGRLGCTKIWQFFWGRIAYVPDLGASGEGQDVRLGIDWAFVSPFVGWFDTEQWATSTAWEI